MDSKRITHLSSFFLNFLKFAHHTILNIHTITLQSKIQPPAAAAACAPPAARRAEHGRRGRLVALLLFAPLHVFGQRANALRGQMQGLDVELPTVPLLITRQWDGLEKTSWLVNASKDRQTPSIVCVSYNPQKVRTARPSFSLLP